MARKKKRGFPSKTCPKCGKVIHARKSKCPIVTTTLGSGTSTLLPPHNLSPLPWSNRL